MIVVQQNIFPPNVNISNVQMLIFQDPEGINMCNKLNLKLGGK